MLTNIISNMKQVIEEKGEILEELNSLRYSRSGILAPPNTLRPTTAALQSYKLLLEELPLPTV